MPAGLRDSKSLCSRCCSRFSNGARSYLAAGITNLTADELLHTKTDSVIAAAQFHNAETDAVIAQANAVIATADAETHAVIAAAQREAARFLRRQT